MNELYFVVIVVVLLLLVDSTTNTTYHREATTSQHTAITNNFNTKVTPFMTVKGTTIKSIPSIFVSGTQKGGSSSLYEFLIQHPLLCGGTLKDPHYFDFYYNKGRSHYESYYIDSKCQQQHHSSSSFIDGSTMLHSMDIIAPRIASFYTEEEKKLLKFIVLLREPVARDYSWYSHVIKRDLADGIKFDIIKTFKEIDEASVLANSTTHRSGRYITQLSIFTKYFNRNQILILNSQSLFTNSSVYMESIRKFLNLPKYKPWEGKFPKEEHIGYTTKVGLLECITKHIPALDCDFRDLLGRYYQPYNTNLYNWIQKTPNKSKEEPTFNSFGDDYTKINCVSNSRELFDKILKKDTSKSCTTIKT